MMVDIPYSKETKWNLKKFSFEDGEREYNVWLKLLFRKKKSYLHCYAAMCPAGLQGAKSTS